MSIGNIVARVLYRDALMLVIDKPAGLAVHPGPRGRDRETLTDRLDELRFGLPRRPEAAHRLDRDTSGCLVLGRHAKALARLGELFRSGAVEKRYWALVEGGPAGEAGEIALPIGRASTDPRNWRMRAGPGGQPALTRWRVLGRREGAAWLELEPVTGRTHQLRVHCATSGWPIRGDALYGAAARSMPLLLHARSVAIPLYPRKAPVLIEASAPAHLHAALAVPSRGASSTSPAPGAAAARTLS